MEQIQQINRLNGSKNRKFRFKLKETRKDVDTISSSHEYIRKKAIIKATKQIKTQLILKYTRRVKEMSSNDDNHSSSSMSSDKLSTLVGNLRRLDHTDFAEVLITAIDDETNIPENIDKSLLKMFIDHKIMHTTIETLDSRLKKKLSSVKLLSKSDASRQPVSKSLRSLFKETASVQNNERSKAIFLESLNDEEAHHSTSNDTQTQLKQRKINDYDVQKKRKHLNDKVQQDLSPYMPVNKRRRIETLGADKHIEERSLNNRSSEKPANKEEIKVGSNVINKIQYHKDTSDSVANNSKPGSKDIKQDKVSKANTKNTPVPSTVTKEVIANGKDWKSTGLHPSWAAKMVSKAPVSIEPYAGKKIIFSDD